MARSLAWTETKGIEDLAEIDVNDAIFDAQHHALLAQAEECAERGGNPQQAVGREAGVEVGAGVIGQDRVHCEVVAVDDVEAKQAPGRGIAEMLHGRGYPDGSVLNACDEGSGGRSHSITRALSASF